MTRTHVVVDGSNLATEGRTMPSLSQLEDAIAAYEDEHPEAEIIVVVDATFEHRIDAKDRDRLKEAELRGEVVSPPAGAIGRGDAFVLKIATRTDGIVLSNDSFQEFHGEHPWLFEEGRLIGGKPVTGVGWIFTPRTPVRGPKSRAATQSAKKKSAAAAGPVKKLSVTRPDGSTPKVGDVLTPAAPPPPPEPKNMRAYELAKELGLDNKELLAAAKKAKVAIKSHSSTVSPADADVIRDQVAAALASRKIRAYELAKELGLENKELLALAKKAKVDVASHSSSILLSDADVIRAVAKKAQRTAAVVAEAASAPDEEPPAGEQRSGRRRRRRRGGAGEQASEQAPTVEPATKSTAKRSRAKKAPAAEMAKAAAPEPTNAPLAFLSFVATYEVGAAIEGTVAQFTSHGAMVDVDLDGEQVFRCYAPTERLGTPAPSKARDVLTRGERSRFTLVAIDPTRRVAELELA